MGNLPGGQQTPLPPFPVSITSPQLAALLPHVSPGGFGEHPATTD